MKKIYFLFLLVACSVHAWSQNTLPPNQPEQSSCNPLVICGPTFTSPYSYQGYGLVNDLTNTPCAGGEANSVWLKLEINTPGTIVFTLTPIVPTDDYDMAIVDATNVACDALTTANVIRCNYNNNSPGSNVNGTIGLNATSLLNFVMGGTFGNSFLQQINAAAGDVYLIMLNNFGYYTGTGGLGGGFTIDFTGSTATFNQPTRPAITQVVPYCNLSQSVKIKTNQRIKCSSIAADGSDFFLTPSGTILSAVGTNCAMATGGYTDEITITFNGTLPNGFYNLNAQIGTDGNSLLNLCDGDILLPNSVPFQVGNNPIEITKLDTPACQFLRITLNSPIMCNSISPNFSEFSITGPSTVGIQSVVGENCGGLNTFTNTLLVTLTNPIEVEGQYYLNINTGTDFNTLIDSCGRSVPIGENVAFNIKTFNGKLQASPDGKLACYFGEMIDLTATNSGIAPTGGFNYTWTSPNYISNPNALSTTGAVPNILNYFILSTVDTFGCMLKDSVRVRVQPFNTAVHPEEAIACEGEEVIVEALEGTKFDWSITSGTGIIENPTGPKTNIYPDLGQVIVNLTAEDSRGCVDKKDIILNVYPGPTLIVTPKDTTIEYGASVVLNAIGAESYQWYPFLDINNKDLPHPLVYPKEDRWYQITGWNEYGCPSIDSVLVRVKINSNPILPNAFTPNGDGLNDVFGINNFQYERLLVFNVYDRMGAQVFSTNNKNVAWDGTYQNGKEAPTAVYYYYIEYTHEDSSREVIKGDVTLLR